MTPAEIRSRRKTIRFAALHGMHPTKMDHLWGSSAVEDALRGQYLSAFPGAKMNSDLSWQEELEEEAAKGTDWAEVLLGCAMGLFVVAVMVLAFGGVMYTLKWWLG